MPSTLTHPQGLGLNQVNLIRSLMGMPSPPAYPASEAAHPLGEDEAETGIAAGVDEARKHGKSCYG